MRKCRVLKIFLVSTLGFLLFTVLSGSRSQNHLIDEALDATLENYLHHLPIVTHKSCLNRHPRPQSPRDFQASQRHFVSKACQLLSTRKILLVGPETTYFLHSLWLAALKTRDHRTHHCHGPEFCKFHHICLPAGHSSSPRDRYKVPPTDKELVATNSTLMRYVLSTSLHTAKNKNDPGYTQVVVDPDTGIRLKNGYWLAQARRADIIVLNRGPIPAPAWTYSGETLGNWTFTRNLPRHLVLGNSLSADVLNAAFHATVTRFIPEVLQSLGAVQQDPLIRHKTLAWHASWFLGPQDFHAALQMDDPWALYYSAQGGMYMQNRLLTALLPHYNVHFLSPIAPSRFLADKAPADNAPRDMLQFTLGTTNSEAMATMFVKSLIELLECVK
ncbi:hypothetical protein R3P38DRAFT_2497937 [Favolaschia claudopus]|uniref:Uncharacterized protein n=1 Tax=Favolaschia claudopus TaxID=2862362 RepID=A0AAW0E1C6_9AGAR